MVVIETRAAIEDSEVIIIDITEIIAGVLSTIHKNGPMYILELAVVVF
jgi:hypothetical protein